MSASDCAVVCQSRKPSFVAIALNAQRVTVTISAGTGPYAAAVNPVTNKIYVATGASADVRVIDGATGNTNTFNSGIHSLSALMNPVAALLRMNARCRFNLFLD